MNYEEEYYESDLDLDIYINEEEDFNQEEELQRTEQWQLDRLGKLTGSKGKLIMGCNRKGSKLSWSEKEKVFEFSESIVPYIYTCAMERKTGKYIEGSSTMAMKYGTVIEPLISRRVQEEYLDKMGLKAEDVGFKEFDEIPTAGASADKIVKDLKGKNKGVAEFKACTNWSTHYKRTYEKTDESSMDFWQMIIEMIAWGVNKAYYVVATPPQNIMKYITAENAMELYNDWCEETQISFEEIEISEIHIEALKHRIVIIESCIQKYIATGRPIATILEEEVNFHKKKYLDKITAYDEIENTEEDFAVIEPKQNQFKQDLFEDSPF